MDQDSQKRDFSDYTQEELSKLSVNQIQQLFMETLKEIVEVSASATRHINQLDEYRKKAEQSGDEKTAGELGQVVDTARTHLNEELTACGNVVENIKAEDAKTISIVNQSSKAQEKAFVETISSDARAQDEYIQARRDARYEELIQEAGEIESPANRLHH